MNCNQSLIFTVNFCAQKCRTDLDTVWRFVYIACFTNDSLLELNRNSTRWCLSHWYRCIWFPYERYRRLGRRRFRLCHGLWWFHILKGARCLLMQTEREKERKEQASKEGINQPIWCTTHKKQKLFTISMSILSENVEPFTCKCCRFFDFCSIQ